MEHPPASDVSIPNPAPQLLAAGTGSGKSPTSPQASQPGVVPDSAAGGIGVGVGARVAAGAGVVVRVTTGAVDAGFRAWVAVGRGGAAGAAVAVDSTGTAGVAAFVGSSVGTAVRLAGSSLRQDAAVNAVMANRMILMISATRRIGNPLSDTRHNPRFTAPG